MRPDFSNEIYGGNLDEKIDFQSVMFSSLSPKIFIFWDRRINIISLARQHFCCSSRRQRSSLLWPARPAPRAGAGRHGATSLRGQVSSATSPCERRIQFLWRKSEEKISNENISVKVESKIQICFLGRRLVIQRFTPALSLVWTGYADFSSRHRQANLKRKHVISSGTKDFVSFRQLR